MSKHRSTLEWEFLAEGDPYEPWPPAPHVPAGFTVPAAASRLRRALLFGLSLTILLIAGIAVAYANHEAEQGVRAIEQDVQAAANAEQWVAQNAPEQLAAVIVGDDASTYAGWIAQHEQFPLAAPEGMPAPVPQIQDTWFAHGKVAATLTLAQPGPAGGASGVYRQTRFYRETAEGWLRTKPDLALWGSPRTLETAHLTWRYRTRDQAVVAAVADQMEALYVKLQHDYGLAQAAEEGKQVIDVQVDDFPKSSAFFSPSGTTISVASPAVYLIPVERTDADILAQAVALALLHKLWAQTMTRHGIEPSFLLSEAIGLWELWDTDLGLSAWQDEIMQWILGDGSSAGDSTVAILPARYDEICATYAIWGIKPFAVGISLSCSTRDSDPAHAIAYLRSLRGENMKMFQTLYLHHAIRDTLGWGNAITLYTVIDYAVTTYGRERLPALVAGLGTYDTWAALVPAVFGVSLDEFDAGWRTYLAKHYATATPRAE